MPVLDVVVVGAGVLVAVVAGVVVVVAVVVVVGGVVVVVFDVVVVLSVVVVVGVVVVAGVVVVVAGGVTLVVVPASESHVCNPDDVLLFTSHNDTAEGPSTRAGSRSVPWVTVAAQASTCVSVVAARSGVWLASMNLATLLVFASMR